jgi:tRNA threonylcarbamoyl adenosine modification protein YeaZ
MLLAIETGFGACSVALLDGDTVVAARHELIGRGHDARLVPLVGEVLAEAGRAPDQVLVDVGPGSFTGIRVGIAAARAFGLAWRVPVRGFSSTALVAATALTRTDRGKLSAVLDGGRGELFVESFEGLQSLGPVEALRPAEAAARDLGALAGAGAPRLAPLLPDSEIVSAELPNAAAVCLLPPAMRNLPLHPLYVRPPDAKRPGA